MVMMPIDPTFITMAGNQIQSAERILLVSHIRPDGDAIGSLIGLGLALEAVGKEVQMVLQDGVLSKFSYLNGSKKVRHSAEGEFDMVCSLDCSDLGRLGDVLEGRSPPDLNIDHHRTNLNFGKINLVDEQAVATAELITEFLPIWDLPLTQDIAEGLLTGMITDTIGFQTSNMRPSALRVAATLMEAGADLPRLYHLGLVDHSYETMRLWGIGLSNLMRKGTMIWSSITLEERAAIGYPGRDDGDLVNLLGTVAGIDVAIIFNEQADQHVKVSWRSQTGYDVSSLALSFGGGGHPAASGAVIEGNLSDVRKNILEATAALINS
jgi:bifunctional oligoribonuclease and PAP phosphatase NrnA